MQQAKPHGDHILFHLCQRRKGKRAKPVLRHESGIGLLLDALDLRAGIEDIDGRLAIAPFGVIRASRGELALPAPTPV